MTEQWLQRSEFRLQDSSSRFEQEHSGMWKRRLLHSLVCRNADRVPPGLCCSAISGLMCLFHSVVYRVADRVPPHLHALRKRTPMPISMCSTRSRPLQRQTETVVCLPSACLIYVYHFPIASPSATTMRQNKMLDLYRFVAINFTGSKQFLQVRSSRDAYAGLDPNSVCCWHANEEWCLLVIRMWRPESTAKSTVSSCCEPGCHFQSTHLPFSPNPLLITFSAAIKAQCMTFHFCVRIFRRYSIKLLFGKTRHIQSSSSGNPEGFGLREAQRQLFQHA